VALDGAENKDGHIMVKIRFWKTGVLVGILASLVMAVSVKAQTGTTSLHGVVTDRTGATVGSAKVIVSNGGQGLNRELDTNAAGEYEFL
jgi:hypothetical protein